MTDDNQPKFLSNKPIAEDLFKSNSHQITANRISAILQDNNNDFSVIGIEGKWGSGKSNLVGIIQKELEPKNFHFFIYDVWGHQEDEQRRSILEELTNFIIQKKLLTKNKSKWKNTWKHLLSKKITTKTKKTLTIITIITLIIDMLCIIILSRFHDKFDFLNILDTNSYLVQGLSFFILALQYIFHKYQKYISNNKIEENIYEDIPSVYSFRAWLDNIDNDIEKNNKLIIVFDNFDRLPKHKITELWASIHTFFAEDQNQAKEHTQASSDKKYGYSNIKVLIPFDQTHLQQAFTSDNGDFTTDYINKTFDITFRVAEPTNNDWKDLFKSKWKEALDNNLSKEDEYLAVEQIFNISDRKKTPRNIIAFINQIVTLKLILTDNVLERYIALFVIYENVITKDIALFLDNKEYIKKISYFFNNGEELINSIAMITYQTTLNNAIEILYTKQLEYAINNNKEELFIKIFNSRFCSSIIIDVLTNLTDIQAIHFSLPIIYKTLNEQTNISKKIQNNIYDIFKKKFEEYGNENINSTSPLLTELKETSEYKLIPSKIFSHFIKQVFSNGIVQDMNTIYYDYIAMALADNNFIDYINNNDIHYSFNEVLRLNCNSKLNMHYLVQAAHNMKFYITFEDYLLKDEKFFTYPLCKNIIQYLIENPQDNTKWINLDGLLLHFENICTKIKIEPIKLVEQLNNWDCNELSIEQCIEYPNFYYQIAIETDNTLAKHTINQVTEYFKNLNKDGWLEILGDFNSNKFQILKTINFNNWNTAFFVALKEKIKGLLKNESINDIEEWKYLIKQAIKIQIFSIPELFKDIRDLFINSELTMNVNKFIFLANYLFAYANLQEKAQDIFRAILPVELLDNDECINILQHHAKKIKEMLKLTEKENSRTFIIAINEKQEQNKDIKVLADNLGLNKKRTT